MQCHLILVYLTGLLFLGTIQNFGVERRDEPYVSTLKIARLSTVMLIFYIDPHLDLEKTEIQSPQYLKILIVLALVDLL